MKPSILFFGVFFILLSFTNCGTTKLALRTHEDLKWAKDNYYDETLKLFSDVFTLESRDLRNGAVYYLSELYFKTKVPLLSNKTSTGKKWSPKQLQQRAKKKETKAKIITLLKKHFFFRKGF